MPYVPREFTKSSFPVLLIHNAGVLKILRGGQRPLRGQLGGAAAVHPVEHQAGQRHVLRGQPLHEVRGLAQRVPLGGRHHQEGRTGRLEQLVRGVGARTEAAEHGVHRGHEGLHVSQQLAPITLLSAPVIIDIRRSGTSSRPGRRPSPAPSAAG